MPWFNVDDGFANSKPVLRISRRYRCAAVGLWTLAGSWSAKELTDGFVPDHAIEEFASTPAMAEQLVRADLWTRVAEGWQFNNWAKYQKTKEQVYAFRAAEAERKRKQRSGGKPPGGGGLSRPDSDRTEPAVPPGRETPSGIPIPEPLPTPIPLSVETSSGGVTEVDAPENPRPHCNRHPNENAPGSCPACGRRRKWDEAEAQRLKDDELADRRRRRAAIDACLLCDAGGMRDFGSFSGRCTHPNNPPELQEASNA
jgi:hypothetical protein